MWGFIIHVSNPIRNTACTAALKNIPDTLWFAPYFRKIINNCAQLFLKLFRFFINSGQSSSDSVIILPRYLNNVTEFGDIM